MRRPLPPPLLVLAALCAPLGLSCRGQGPQPAGAEAPPAAALQPTFDPAAIGPGPAPRPGPARPLDVLDHGPVGRSEGGVDIHVRFNQPVVPLEQQSGDLTGLFTIDPPLPGRAYWKTPDLLVFAPDAAPAPCHAYKVRFNGGVVGLDGQRFDRSIDWSFETERPLVVGSFPESRTAGDDGADGDGERGDSRRDTTVLIEFDRAVDLREVQAHVQASARRVGKNTATGAAVPVRVRLATAKEIEAHFYYSSDQQRQVYAVQPRGLWPLDSEIEVRVTPGLRSEDGPLPLDTPWAMALRTHGPQRIDAMNCAPEAPCGLEPLTLKLHNPVEDAQLRKISVSPRPKYLRISNVDYWDENGRELLIEGQFIPGTTYTVRLPPDFKDIYGQTLPGGLSRAAVVAPRATMALSARTGTLPVGKQQTVGVESRHITAMRVRVGVYTDAELRAVPLAPGDLDKLAFPAAVHERTLPLTPTGKADWASLTLDLKDLAKDARGAVLVEVSATELVERARPYGAPPAIRGLYRLTDLGPVAVVSLPATSVQVLRLSSGAPVPGARISVDDLSKPRELGVTDKDGLLALPANLVPWRRPKSPAPPTPPLRLVVHEPQTNDRAYLNLEALAPASALSAAPDSKQPDPLRPGERLLAQIVSERGVYRPGEKVRVVGWSAVDTPFARSNLGRLKAGTPVTFELIDPFKKVVATHATKVSADGKFWAELQLPVEVALGGYSVVAELAGDRRTASVKVEDYRVPEYTVEARARRTDILAGERTPIEVRASYYFGGPVPIKRLTRQTVCHRQAYRPPGLEARWHVGEPIPYDHTWRANSPRVVEGTPATTIPGRRDFDEAGTARETRYPYRCTTSVEVQDASLQGIGAETTFAIHPAAFYLALARPDTYLEATMTGLRIPLRAVDPQGQRVAASAAELVISRHWPERSYRPEGGKQVFDKWVERSAPVVTCKLEPTASGPDPGCDLPALVEGRYELAVSATEPGSTRVARTSMSFHVGPKRRPADSSWRSHPAPRLEVLAERDTVRPGETLEIAVRGPWPSAHGTLVLAREGLREAHPVVLTDGQALFKFNVDDTWTPNVHFFANIVAPGNGHPALHRASVRVTQSAEHRRLDVSVDAPPRVGPGDPVDLRVRVRDDHNQPTAARVALWAVDEAVLDLTAHEVPDLLPRFVPDRSPELAIEDDYATLLYPYFGGDADPWFAPINMRGLGLSGTSRGGGGTGSGFGMGAGSGGPPMAPPARSRFETTPVFLADLAVDRSGEASVKARMPENLGTFRITAIASARLVDGGGVGRFGKNDARTVVTAPLVLRAAMPRQLRPGDRAEVAAIVQNNTGAAGRVQVQISLPDKTGTKGHALKVTSKTSASAELEDGGQARLVFEVQADGPGAPDLELQATLTPSAGGPPIHDGLRLPLPIAPERTLTERVAAYGELNDDQAIAIPIKIPRDVLPGHGGVTIDTSSTLLGGLEDAVRDLVHYPYGCIEQTSSGLLPIVALGPLAANYPLGIPDTKAFVRAGVDRILSMQTASGGFGYWPGATEVHVYASAYATWVLQLAAKAGHPVPEDALRRALDALEARIGGTRFAQIPVDWGYHDGVRTAIALHALAEAGRDVRKPAAELHTLRQQLPLYARAFLLMALHRQDPAAPEVRALLGELLGNIQELPATAHTQERWLYNSDEFFASDGRSDAIVLMTLLRVEPGHPLVTKLARGLLERRIGGRWRNTQENAYALVALTDFARIHEAELPDLRARAWVGGANVLDVQFKGRELDTRTATTAMEKIIGLSRAPGDELLPVVLQRSGQGRLYYRLGAEWAPSAQAELPARSQGFTLTRTLRTAAGAASLEVPAGEPIAMDITIRGDARVRYVVIDIPLPAGLEGVSRTLGKGRRAAVLAGHRGGWVSHEEQRPDRVVVFADDLGPGTHHHTIDLRSTSRGQFSFPPATAEAMYMPEVHGRTAGAALDVR
jgi:uncharacterized protein YfaS (alpha-2-macroglobulin family)